MNIYNPMANGILKSFANSDIRIPKPIQDIFDEGIDKIKEVLQKGGEGSKGGKVIGHTKSGKPIYNTHEHESHNSFTKEDHKDASQAHVDMMDKHRNSYWTVRSDDKKQEHQNKLNIHHKEAMYHSNLSRKEIIGHTRNNDPIYDKSNHEAHKHFSKEDHKDAAAAHMSIIEHKKPTTHSDTYHDEQRADHARKVDADNYRDSNKKYDQTEKSLTPDDLIDNINIVFLDALEKGRKADPIGTRKRFGSIDYVKTADGWTSKKEVKEAHDKIHQTKYESTQTDPNKLHYTKDTEIHAIRKIEKEGLKTTKHHNINDGSGYFEIHKDNDESDNEPKSFDNFKSSVKIERGSGYGQYSVTIDGHKFHSTNSKAFDADPEDDNYNDVMKTLYNEYKNSL